MPIPVLLAIGIGAVSAVVTAAATVKMRRDKKRYNDRRSTYKQFSQEYTDFVDEVNDRLEALHQQRVSAQETLYEAADFLIRANVKERVFDPSADITTEEFAELKNVSATLTNFAINAGSGVAGGAVLGASAAAGTYAAVGAFGTASTGAPISGLAGIAARNATLAWLGGGSLATGGAGIAGGVASLSSIASAPLAVIPAVVLGRKALKQGNQIDEEIQKMDQSTAEIDRHRAELQALLHRTEEMSKAVDEVEGTLKTVLKSALARVIEDVHRVATAAKALAQLLDIRPPSDNQKPASGETTHD